MLNKLSVFFTLSLVLLVAAHARAQLPSKLKADDQAKRDTMVKISRQLGVTCSACHNTSNFASSEKIQFKTSREHIKLTQTLIDSGFDGQNNHPMADCYMCHRGKLKPDYKEPYDAMTMRASPNSSATDKKSPAPDED